MLKQAGIVSPDFHNAMQRQLDAGPKILGTGAHLSTAVATGGPSFSLIFFIAASEDSSGMSSQTSASCRRMQRFSSPSLKLTRCLPEPLSYSTTLPWYHFPMAVQNTLICS